MLLSNDDRTPFLIEKVRKFCRFVVPNPKYPIFYAQFISQIAACEKPEMEFRYSFDKLGLLFTAQCHRTYDASSMLLSEAVCGVPASQALLEIRTCFLRASTTKQVLISNKP